MPVISERESASAAQIVKVQGARLCEMPKGARVYERPQIVILIPAIPDLVGDG
jgi:hypothetical protein